MDGLCRMWHPLLEFLERSTWGCVQSKHPFLYVYRRAQSAEAQDYSEFSYRCVLCFGEPNRRNSFVSIFGLDDRVIGCGFSSAAGEYGFDHSTGDRRYEYSW